MLNHRTKPARLSVILFERLNLLVKLASGLLEISLFPEVPESKPFCKYYPFGLFGIQKVPLHRAQLLGLGLCLHSRALGREVHRVQLSSRGRRPVCPGPGWWPFAKPCGGEEEQFVCEEPLLQGRQLHPGSLLWSRSTFGSQETRVTNGSPLKGGREICMQAGCASEGGLRQLGGLIIGFPTGKLLRPVQSTQTSGARDWD